MSDLIELQSQIQKLQKQAADIRAREFDATVREILAKMDAFGITVKDLQNPSTKRSKVKTPVDATSKGTVAKTKQKSVKKPVAAKYRGPNGELWTGRGLTPKWLVALEAEGRSKADFVIAD